MLELQRTKLKDIDKVIEIEAHSENSQFILPYSKNRHQEVLCSVNELHLSIFKTEELVGFLILSGVEKPINSIEFRRIVIAQNQKGKGYGRDIIKQIKRLCFETLQCQKLWLDVYHFNKKAIHLYKIEGFIKEKIEGDLIIMSILRNSKLKRRDKQTICNDAIASLVTQVIDIHPLG